MEDGFICSWSVSTETAGEGEELNVAANLSVWGGIMPALNIAARLGRHAEMKVIYVSRRKDDDSKNGFLKLNIKVGQPCVNMQ